MNTVYHLSNVNLELGDYLDPECSYQNLQRVYAHPLLEGCILHASEHKDASIQVFGNGMKSFERYEGALEDEFANKELYVYKIDAIGNTQEGFTELEHTFTFKKKILAKEKIECTLSKIKEFEEYKVIEVYRYPNRPQEYLCKCGILDKDLLIKEILYLLENQNFSSLLDIFKEIKITNPKLMDFCREIIEADTKKEVINLFKCYPEVARQDFIQLKNHLT